MGSAPSILVIDDSSTDVMLLKRAFQKAGVMNPLHWVKSGGEAIKYLEGEAPYQARANFPLPSVILLDLNIPDRNAFDLLSWIRERFPNGGLLIVVLTPVQEIQKLNRAYSLGANSFLTKSGHVEELRELISIFSGYWLLNNCTSVAVTQPQLFPHDEQ